uniref:TFIIS N-terminal domain-containing protein n=1 Tax=Parastrongyloides trichosuri TaxID=131310 RepID=A0A0N4Z4S8_PARTI
MGSLGDADKSVIYLSKLRKLPINLELLVSTGIGKVVNKIVKRGNEEESKLAKEIVTEWKSIINSSENEASNVKDTSSKMKEESKVIEGRKRKSTIDDTDSKKIKKEVKIGESNDKQLSFMDALKESTKSEFKPIKKRVVEKKSKDDVFCKNIINMHVPLIKLDQPKVIEKKENQSTDNFEIKCVKSKIHVYACSGKAKKINLINGQPPTLLSFCQDVVKKNVDKIEFVGLIPYHILKPALERASPETLLKIVKRNPQIEEECDELFYNICKRKPNQFKNRGSESWKETYVRTLKEEEEKFAMLTRKIATVNKKSSASQRKAEVIDLKQVGNRGASIYARSSGQGSYGGSRKGGLEAKYSSSTPKNGPQKKGFLMAKTLRMFKSGGK